MLDLGKVKEITCVVFSTFLITYREGFSSLKCFENKGKN